MNTTTRYILNSSGFGPAFRTRLAIIALLGVVCLCTPRVISAPPPSSIPIVTVYVPGIGWIINLKPVVKTVRAIGAAFGRPGK